MTEITDKQSSCLRSLRTAVVYECRDHGAAGNLTIRSDSDDLALTTRDFHRLVRAALVLAMPAPSSGADASAQISALSGGTVKTYARQFPWAQAALDALGAAWGGTPATWPAQATAGELHSIVTAGAR